MTYLLGVDGGNTKTIALVAEPDGSVVGVGRGGCGDIYGAGSPDHALAAIDHAVGQALEQAGAGAGDLASGAFSLAGADWPEDFAFLEQALRGRGYGRDLCVVNDALGALRAGSPDGTGVIVACGTATAIGAKSADGRVWHSSFWQETGGGGHLAQKAMRAVLRAELEIDPPTQLTARMLALAGAPDIEEMLRRATGREIPKELAVEQRMFHRVLLDCAADGDPTATRLVADHGASLGDYALVAARMVGLLDSAFPLVLAGGVFRHPSPLLADAMVARIREFAPGARPIRSRFEPAVGALLLAFELAGHMVDERVLATLEPTLPPASLFET